MKRKFNFWVITALIFGIIAGIYIPEEVKEISFIGTIYVNLLRFIIIPVIFASISLTIYSSKNAKVKTLTKTIAIFIVMFVLTFLLSSLVYMAVNHFANFKIDNLDLLVWEGQTTNIKISDIIVSLFPNNIVDMIKNNAIFAFILFAAFFGLAASKIDNPKPVVDFLEGIKDIFNKLIEYIMYLTPAAVFVLVSNTVAQHGATIVGMGAKYIGMAYLASVLTLILIMILPVWFYAKVKPLEYIKKVSKVWLITTSTCSSAATLPYTIRTCNKEFGIPEKITNLVVPLGCTIHMCGGAVSFSLLALFSSSLVGMDITLGTYFFMIIGATFINMAAPGIPNGGIVLGATYLSMLGIPLIFIGIYSGMYRLLDMAYTTLNVTGDISANILIYESERRKTNA